MKEIMIKGCDSCEIIYILCTYSIRKFGKGCKEYAIFILPNFPAFCFEQVKVWFSNSIFKIQVILYIYVVRYWIFCQSLYWCGKYSRLEQRTTLESMESTLHPFSSSSSLSLSICDQHYASVNVYFNTDSSIFAFWCSYGNDLLISERNIGVIWRGREEGWKAWNTFCRWNKVIWYVAKLCFTMKWVQTHSGSKGKCLSDSVSLWENYWNLDILPIIIESWLCEIKTKIEV